jgi:hypothetical protein
MIRSGKINPYKSESSVLFVHGFKPMNATVESSHQVEFI